MKTNCDGAYSYETGAGGWGFIIRDEDGDVISAGRGRLDQEPFNASAAPSVHLKSHHPLILLSQRKKVPRVAPTRRPGAPSRHRL